ncbi:MAG: metalloregulator ArsR/SmtB family transcription factor [Planctomycetota bacterium]
MHAFAVLADPVRRSIVQELMGQERSSGELVETVGVEFDISQSAVSQQLKVLRENGFANVAIDGNRRIYSLDSTGFEQMEAWLAPFRQYWAPKFEALANEVAKGKRSKKKR